MKVGFAIVAACLASPALAAPACDVPAQLPTPRIEAASEREPQRLLPIGGYTLSLIWLPERCRSSSGDFDCAADAGRRGFALHGLWPDGRGREWPQWCQAAPVVPVATLRAHYCATPSAQLTQHEWAKHGTCMAGADPDRYLALSRKLFEGMTLPALAPLSRRAQTAASVQRAIAGANPGMRGDMIRLNVDRRGWLQEVWFCLDTRFQPQRCPASQGGARANERVLIRRG